MPAWNLSSPKAEYFDHNSPDIEALVKEVCDQPELAIDSETTGLVVWKDIPLYWSLAFGNRRMTLNASVLPFFKQAFADKRKRWILANAKFDKHMFANVGTVIEGPMIDICVQHALLYEERPHGLKDICMHLFGWKWMDFQDTFGKINKAQSAEQLIRKAEATSMDLLSEYAANDSWGTLQAKIALTQQLQAAPTHSLFRDQEPFIETLDDYFEKLEVPYTSVLWKYERNGIKVDLEYLNEIKPIAEQQIEDLERAIAKEAGFVLNPNSPVQIADYFINKLQLKPLKMTKGGKTGVRKPSVDSGFLEHYEDTVPMAALLLKHRNVSKLYGTYITGLSELVDPFGRIHTRFNQDVARCMPAGELVLTSRGYLPVEQVQVNDSVIAHTGKVRKVIECSTHKPSSIYRVKLSNGLELRTNGTHPYRTGNGWTQANRLQVGASITVHSDTEQWRSITGWEPFEVSSWGRVRNAATHRFLTLQPKGQWGHLKVCLHRNGAQHRGPDRKDFSVHRLVLSAFKQDAENEVRHLNGIAWDNTIANLCYGTSSENRQDALRHGTMSQRRAGRTKLSEEDVAQILLIGRSGQPASSSSKLSFELANLIRQRAVVGEPQAGLAEEYGVSVVAINNIINLKTWTRPLAAEDTTNKLAKQYDVSPGTIRDIWAGRRWQSEDYIEGVAATFFEAVVTSVTVEAAEVTYGLTIEEDHSHVTGGIVTHNTGRLSSSTPNVQNIPKPDKDRWQLRKAFIPDPHYAMVVWDYEQLEMRLLAAGSLDEGMCSVIRAGKDIHMGNAELIFGNPYDDYKLAKKTKGMVDKNELPASAITEYIMQCLAERDGVKTIGFGLIYGMGPAKMARDLGISKEEAEHKIELFLAALPAVAAFAEEAIAETEATGYSFTIMGRRRNVPEIQSSNMGERSKGERIAKNTPIQGSAADVVKMAQILLDKSGIDTRWGFMPMLQVHDEIVGQVPIENAEQAVAEGKDWLEHPFCIDLAVPLAVSGGSGPNWLVAK